MGCWSEAPARCWRPLPPLGRLGRRRCCCACAVRRWSAGPCILFRWRPSHGPASRRLLCRCAATCCAAAGFCLRSRRRGLRCGDQPLLLLLLTLMLLLRWRLQCVHSGRQEGRQVRGDVCQMLLLLSARCDDRMDLRCTFASTFMCSRRGCASSLWY